jgi:selenide,water dikinase
LSPTGLSDLLASLPHQDDPNLLVGMETSDDAGVYRIAPELALVFTADFITPPVDDPYMFGRIAAVNALSDVYAMGGKPLTCMNLVGFPSRKLGIEVLKGIIAGAFEKIHESGAALVGGHSTEDEEPKFGLSVTGTVHPDKIWRNSTAQAGDRLILTKPIGSGVIFNGNRKGWVKASDLEACLAELVKLNRAPAEAAAPYEPHACTDITGFGLAGHTYTMARSAGVTFRISLESVPVMAGALELYRRGVTTGVNESNREMVSSHTRFETRLPPWHQEIVFDPQTAGPLLFSVAASQAAPLVADLKAKGLAAACIIGEVLPFEDACLVFI